MRHVYLSVASFDSWKPPNLNGTFSWKRTCHKFADIYIFTDSPSSKEGLQHRT